MGSVVVILTVDLLDTHFLLDTPYPPWGNHLTSYYFARYVVYTKAIPVGYLTLDVAKYILSRDSTYNT